MNGQDALRFRLLGYPVGFGQPWSLVLLLAAVAVALVCVAVALRRRARIRALVSDPLVDRLAPGASTARALGQAGLYGLALLLLAVALAQPECGSSMEMVKKRGVDIVVALDASKSMLARDILPSRLDRAKLELTTMLDQLRGDRVAIVTFAGDAYIQCPLTTDYSAAKMFLRAVDPEQMPQGGTNIGEAMEMSLKVLNEADRGAKERVIVLLSDGEDLAGEIQPALEQLKNAQVKVYAVGIGSEAGEPIPVLDKHGNMVDYLKDAQGNTVLSKLDRASLATLAEATGGELFYSPKGVAVPEVVAQIDRLQKSELQSRVTVIYDQRFQEFLAPGLLLLALGMALGSRGRMER